MTYTHIAKVNLNLQLKQTLTLLIIVLGASLSSHAQNRDVIDSLPNLGSSSAQFLSKQQSQILGAAYIRQARRAIKFVNDPILEEYINTLGNKLAKHSDSSINAPDKFSFYLAENPTVNAFAVPGGHIVINTGLIENTDNEAELASVLAHEIAHVTQNHSARGIEGSRYDSLISLATILVAVASGSAEAAQAGVAASTGGLIEKRLAYTRRFEREADATGIRTLYKAGYPPVATSKFLLKLQAANQFNGINAPEFLLSHPVTVSRISEAEQRIKSYPPITQQNNNDDFIDIKARISALYSGNSQRLSKQLEQKIASKQQSGTDISDTLYYQYGLSLAKSNQSEKALSQLRKAEAMSPEKVAYQIAIAEAEIDNKNKTVGLKKFKTIYEEHETKMPSIALYYANALILADQSKQAIPVLKRMSRHSPNEPDLHIMLARAYGENDRLFESYVSRSEYHYLRGNFSFAIKQLDNAIATAPNKVERSILLAKKAKVKRELEETKKALG